MSNKITKTIKMILILLILSIATVACGGEVKLTDEQIAILETAAANATETAAAAAAGNNIPVETIVAQTVEAQNAIATQVQAGIDAALATQGDTPPTDDANAPDVADPNSAVQPIQPATDPNLPSGTPQVQVKVNANVRSGPGTNYPVVGVLAKGSVIPVTSKTTSTSGGEWYLVELGGPVSSHDTKSSSTAKIVLSAQEKRQSLPKTAWISKSVTDPVDAAAMANVPPAKPSDIPAPPATATATKTPTSTPTTVSTGTATATSTTASQHTATPTATTTNHTATPTATHTATATPTHTPSSTMTTITVVNNTTVDICTLLIDLETDPWTVNRLGSGKMGPGTQQSFSFTPGVYDFIAEDCNGNFLGGTQELVISPFTWNVN